MRESSITADAIIAADTKDETIADRYSRVIRINLTAVANNCQGTPLLLSPFLFQLSLPFVSFVLLTSIQGKIYRVEPCNKNKWMETTLLQSISIKGRTDLWDRFTPGGSFFGCVPHGCIGMSPSSSS